MTELPPFTDFARQVNTLFTAETAHGPITLQLTEAKELLDTHHPGQLRTPMSLIFINDQQPNMVLSQGIYQLNHPVLGSLSLYVEPILSGSPAPDYQVLIN